MSFNGSGTFVINSTGQPVVTGTVISSSTFNSLTADLGTGLTTAITKDGQTTTTAKIPFAQGLSAAVASNFAAGTVGAPSIYLSTDTTTGLYRIGANNDGFAISGVKLLDLGSALVGITGALTVSTTLGVTGTITPGQTTGIVGTTTNNNAQAGSVGEYIEATAANNSVSLTTAITSDIVSISLTAGDWDIFGMVMYTGAGTTNITTSTGAVSTTSGAIDTPQNTWMTHSWGVAGIVPFNAGSYRSPIPTLRVSLASTTTYYLQVACSFSVSTMTAGGRISARRVR